MDGSRKILRLQGDGAAEFLQSLVTNDVTGVADGLVYAALLTPQGKYLADFFLKADDGDILIDLPTALADMVAARLRMYILRKPLKLLETDITVARGTGSAPAGALPDPRHPALGWRAYGPKAGDDGTDWTALRIAHIIPDYGAELSPDSFILEHGFDRLNGVDFKKGCYVGQEVTARMHHKTDLRKGLARVELDAPIAAGTPITSGDKEVGIITTSHDKSALAYVRFDRIAEDMRVGPARILNVTQHKDI
jgi:folate-binding protein YgfZ